MNVISKDEVDKWNDKHKINNMKHSKSLRNVVNPPRMRALPRSRTHKISPSTILDGAKLMGETFRRSSECPYNEYKESIKKSTATIISRMDANNQESLKQKILESNDIATICANKLMDFSGITNEWVILCLTIGGKMLESRCAV